MNPDLWARAKALFESAVERPRAERDRYVEAAAEGDSVLRAEVESLLSAHDAAEADSFIDEPAVAPLAGLPTEPDWAGRLLGPYRIVGEIGRGGMGAVFRAVRDDDQYHKEVAIKVVMQGVDNDLVRERFRSERQILASFDHPNIARLLDGGSTDDGRPYLVMELVDGRPITLYARDRPLRERLALFRQVCSAVSDAHRKLVVHRDIKPGNILVGPDGVPRLLDFGIAKILEGGPGGGATGLLHRMMTPEYASPEQVRGEPITTASDVYSLGVVLYELVTGERPHRLAGRDLLDLARLHDSDPARPSSVVGPACGPDWARLRRRLRGDLDTIILKALRREPDRRYASVDLLAEDIERHLDGRPVLARPDTAVYRAGKFVRRHRAGVTAVAVLALVAAAASWNLAAQARRVERERDRAQEVSRFLIRLFRVSSPSEARGNALTAREVLEEGVSRIRGDLSGRPDVRATLLQTLGTAYQRLGLGDAAAPLLQESLRLRSEIQEGETLDVAAALHELAGVLVVQGDRAGAERCYRRALAIRTQALGKDSPDTLVTSAALADLQRRQPRD
jgi:eukaryotic-like serine/threonine-protein kinase